MEIKTEKLNTTKEMPKKTLPNLFEEDNKDFWKFLGLSIALHPICFLVLFLAIAILQPFMLVKKPEWKTRDIEFVLTENEADPIDKNTKYRSDKNSRAGGIHDPNRKVSMPSPSPSPAPVAPKAPSKPAVQKTVAPKKPVQTPITQKVAQKPVPTPPKATPRPTKPMAPSQRPMLKPTTSAPAPQMPKLASAPKSPFKIDVPKTSAPVGKGFSATKGTNPSVGGGQGSAYGTANGTQLAGMPAPQFSTTRTGQSGSYGSSGSKGGQGQGGYGTGNMGNPGPGNPSGAPGIDAIKSPQWGPYMRELESKIKRNWHPPKGDQSKRVVLLFKVGRRGELLSVRVANPSGSTANDQAAISAVQMSAPFRALPPEFAGPSVEIEFTFDYNVLGVSYR